MFSGHQDSKSLTLKGYFFVEAEWAFSTCKIILNNVYLCYQSDKNILKTNENHLKAKKFIVCFWELHFKKTLFSKQREDQIPVLYQLPVNNKICLSV